MKTIPSRASRILLIAVVMLFTVGCDQLAKELTRTFLSPLSTKSYLGGFLTLILTQNSGAFLSFGTRLPALVKFLIFTVGAGAAILVGCWLLVFAKQLNRRVIVAGSLILAGALGNLIDRLLFSGRVTDFMVLAIGPVHTGVFNVADLAIMAGSFLLVLGRWRKPGRKNQLPRCER